MSCLEPLMQLESMSALHLYKGSLGPTLPNDPLTGRQWMEALGCKVTWDAH